MKLMSKIKIITLLLYSLVLISPLFELLGIRYIHLMFLQILIIFYLSATSNGLIKHSRVSILWVFLVLILSSISAMYYIDIRLFFLPSFFIASLLFVDITSKNELKHLTIISTKVIFAFIVLSWIALIYTLLGGKPIFEVLLPDGRTFSLLLSSFTVTYELTGHLGIIRPSAIYDEPGAFSFVICYVCICRHLMGLDRNLTWLILLSGLITFSLAHVVYIVIHFLSENHKALNLKRLFLLSVFSLFIISFIPQTQRAFQFLLIERFERDQHGTIKGDNRRAQLLYNFEMLSKNKGAILWGVDDEPFISVNEMKAKYPGYSYENPLSPLILRGVFSSFVYYASIIILIVVGLSKRRYFVLIGLALLFFQRPYIMNLGYSLYLLIPLLYIYIKPQILVR